ncbi:MAG: alpha-amylase family glycosyl hydrolase, partial [Verrucomicrobiales bacterium]
MIAGAAGAAPPGWAKDAIWYNIFPERFRNGDVSNDPSVDSLHGTWPFELDARAGWQVSPWTSDWYQPHAWESANGRGFYYNAQLRRYGGDLQGIIDKLDYLKALGVNAVYLNPVFESPSLHKYGAAMYHHIDNHFGPDPEGDARIWAQEDPARPETWRWTAADKLFLKLIAELHKRDMRIIIDGVFNHVGIPFWALQRARAEGPASDYSDWFAIKSWDDPETPGDEFDYEGWAGFRGLPLFKHGPTGPNDEVKAHFRAVVGRWMDPDGDGDPSDGIDGWRLDVAAEVPIAFWREFRSWVREINPDAYLTGEIWWEDYASYRLKNAARWLRGGDVFDSVMNYRFADATYQFFNQTNDRLSAAEFVAELERVHDDYGYDTILGIQNLLGSHDTQRLASMVENPTH